MAYLSTRPNPLKFTGGYHASSAIWPSEPDITVIKSLASRHLASELPDTLDLDQIQIQFFAQGSFNKLYSISYSGHSTDYLLRVALPIVPYHRIENEAAVLSYLKGTTSIPIARVIAYESSAATDFGFEWILLEKLEGVALYDVWRKITWESKLQIIAALASLLGQLRDHKFDRIGSLYFKGRENHLNPEYQSGTTFSTPNHSTDGFRPFPRGIHDKDGNEHERQASESPNVEALFSPPEKGLGTLGLTAAKETHHFRPDIFAKEIADATAEEASEQKPYIIGPLLDPLFFQHRRLYLPGNRGPYRNSREWMAAEIDFQRTWVKTGLLIKTLPSREDFEYYDWNSDNDKEAPEMKKLLKAYQDVLPEIFPAEQSDPPYHIYHHDLSLANILVNPHTYEITGIIDWEMIQVVPEWSISRFPRFLSDQMDSEEIDNEEPRIPTSAEYDEDGDDYNPDVTERRDRWDNKILRQHYDEAMSCMRGGVQVSGHSSDLGKIRRTFEAHIMLITDAAGGARRWLRRYLENFVVATTKRLRDQEAMVVY